MLKFAFNLIDDGLVGQQVFAGEATRLAYMTDEADEGRDSFLQKRDPDWSDFPWHSRSAHTGRSAPLCLPPRPTRVHRSTRLELSCVPRLCLDFLPPWPSALFPSRPRLPSSVRPTRA